jgi:hypothetical protein
VLFPNSEWVLGQAAVAQYNLRNFDVAQSFFEELRLRDPYRTEVRALLELVLFMCHNALSRKCAGCSSDVQHSTCRTCCFSEDSNACGCHGTPEQLAVLGLRSRAWTSTATSCM